MYCAIKKIKYVATCICVGATLAIGQNNSGVEPVKPAFTPYAPQNSSYYGGIDKDLDLDQRSGPITEDPPPEPDGGGNQGPLTIPFVSIHGGGYRGSYQSVEANLTWSLAQSSSKVNVSGYSLQTRNNDAGWTEIRFIAKPVGDNLNQEVSFTYSPAGVNSFRILPKLTNEFSEEFKKIYGIDIRYGYCFTRATSTLFSNFFPSIEHKLVDYKFIYREPIAIGFLGPVPDGEPSSFIPKRYIERKETQKYKGDASSTHEIVYRRPPPPTSDGGVACRDINTSKTIATLDQVRNSYWEWDEVACDFVLVEEPLEETGSYCLEQNVDSSCFSHPEIPDVKLDNAGGYSFPNFAGKPDSITHTKTSIIKEWSVSSSGGDRFSTGGEFSSTNTLKDITDFMNEWGPDDTGLYLNNLLLKKSFDEYLDDDFSGTTRGLGVAVNFKHYSCDAGSVLVRGYEARAVAPRGVNDELIPFTERDFVLIEIDETYENTYPTKYVSSTVSYRPLKLDGNNKPLTSLHATDSHKKYYGIGRVDLSAYDYRGEVADHLEENTKIANDAFQSNFISSEERIGPTLYTNVSRYNSGGSVDCYILIQSFTKRQEDENGKLSRANLAFFDDPNAKAILEWEGSNGVVVESRGEELKSGDPIIENKANREAKAFSVSLKNGWDRTGKVKFTLTAYNGEGQKIGEDSLVVNIVKGKFVGGPRRPDPDEQNSAKYNYLSTPSFGGNSNRAINLNGLPAQNTNIYVDAYDLQLRNRVNDLSIKIPGSHLSLNVNRSLTGEVFTFNSGLRPDERLDRPFGAAWASNLSPTIEFTSYTELEDAKYIPLPSATVIDESGNVYLFRELNNQYIPVQTGAKNADYLRTSLALQGQDWILTKPDGTTCTYKTFSKTFSYPSDRYTGKGGNVNLSYARLIKAEDRFGYSIQYSYNGKSTIPWKMAAHNPSGNAIPSLAIHVKQNSSGYVETVWDPMGNSVAYAYDQKVVPHSVSTEHLDFSSTTSYPLLAQVSPLDSHPTEYDYGSGLYKVKDNLERHHPEEVSEYHHINLFKISQGAGATKQTIEFSYGRNTLEKNYSFVDPSLLFSSVSAPREIVSVKLPDGSTSYFKALTSSFADGRFVSVTDAMGKETRYEFEAPFIRKFNSFEAGYVNTGESDFTLPTVHIYRKLRVVNAEGGTEVFDYDISAGLALSRHIDLNGNETNFVYGDSWVPPASFSSAYPGLVAKHAQPTKIIDALNQETDYTYTDDYRILTSSKDEKNQRIVYEVDALGRILSVKRYGDLTNTSLLSHTSLEYDTSFPNFVLKKTVHALNPTTDNPEKDIVQTFVKDAHGRIAELHRYPSGESVPADALITYFGYDWNNVRRYVEAPTGDKSTSDLALTVTTLDARNRIVDIHYPDGYRHQCFYDGFGRKYREIDRAGNEVFYDYSILNQREGVRRVLNSSEEITTLMEYSAVGELLSQTDPEGLKTTYIYDDLHRLVSSSNPVQGKTSYTNGDLGTKTVFGLKYQPTEVTDPRGYRTSIVYDALYRRESVKNFYGKISPNEFLEISYEYDSVNQLKRVLQPDGTAYRYDYDGLGRRTAQHHDSTTAGVSRTNTFDYTSTNLVWRSIDELNNETLREYNGMGQLVQVKQPLQGTERLIVDYSYDRAGNQVEMSDSNDRVSNMEYDVLNRLIEHNSPSLENGDRAITKYSYDPIGNISRITDPLSRETAYNYDNAYRLKQIDLPAVDGVIHSRMMEYDHRGLRTSLTDEAGYEHTYSYDPAGRLIEQSSPLNQTTNAVTKYTYDSAGNMLSMLDAKNQRYTYSYDGLGRVVETVDPSGATIINTYSGPNLIFAGGLGDKGTTYEYDQYNQLKSDELIQGISGSAKRTYGYDTAGRLTSISSTGEEEGVSYQYDSLGRMIEETSQGVTNIHSYDLYGNLESTTYGATNTLINYTYDALDRLEKITQGNQRVDYKYDIAGNLTHTDYANSTNTPHTKISAIYDARNRKIQQQGAKATGELIYRHEYDYDALSNVTQIAETNSGSLFNRVVDLSYDHASRLLSESISVNAGAATTQGYGYDALNNITSRDASAQRTYQYDALNQLLSYQEGASTTNFTYDASGNRISQEKNGTITNYVYDVRNRLTAIAVGGERRSVGIYKDSNYNELLAEAHYNILDPAVNQVTRYSYDVLSRRIREQTGDDLKKYHYSEMHLIQEFEYDLSPVVSDGPPPPTTNQDLNTAALSASYIRGVSVGGPVGGILYSNRGGTITWNHYNHRGDVIAQTSASGAATYQASYEAHGMFTQQVGNRQGRFAANTKELDPTGLLYEGYRYRDLNTGSFLTRDPAGFVDGPNRYGYVRANPWTLFDAYGLQSQDPVSGGFVISRSFEGDSHLTQVTPTPPDPSRNRPSVFRKLWDYYNSQFEKGLYPVQIGPYTGYTYGPNPDYISKNEAGRVMFNHALSTFEMVRQEIQDGVNPGAALYGGFAYATGIMSIAEAFAGFELYVAPSGTPFVEDASSFKDRSLNMGIGLLSGSSVVGGARVGGNTLRSTFRNFDFSISPNQRYVNGELVEVRYSGIPFNIRRKSPNSGGNQAPSSAAGNIKFKRWSRGDAIDKPLPDGSAPTWGTVQSRYWKNRYEASRSSGEFTQANLDRMRRGTAPQDYNPRTGAWESRELHHVNPQRAGGSNSPINLRELTPDWHSEVDPFRHVPGVPTSRGIR